MGDEVRCGVDEYHRAERKKVNINERRTYATAVLVESVNVTFTPPTGDLPEGQTGTTHRLVPDLMVIGSGSTPTGTGSHVLQICPSTNTSAYLPAHWLGMVDGSACAGSNNTPFVAFVAKWIDEKQAPYDQLLEVTEMAEGGREEEGWGGA